MNQLLYEKDARQQIKNGLDKLADMVKVTYGAKGRNVILSRPSLLPYITKDGVTVAKEVNLEDPIENIGAFLGKQIANSSDEKAGDGTTSSTVLAQAIVNEAFKAISEEYNEVYIKRGIDTACEFAVARLKKISKRSTSNKVLKSIATISANGEKEIGDLIANVYTKAGKDGVIKIEESGTNNTFVETVDGYEIDNGYLHHGFINNDSTGQVEFRDSYVYLFDGYIEDLDQLKKLFEVVFDTETKKLKKAVVIVSDNIDTGVLNRLSQLAGTGENILAIKSPSYGSRRSDVMKDISILLGCKIYTKETIADITEEGLGNISSVICDANRALITGGNTSKDEVAERITAIKKQKQKEKVKKEKEFLEERVGKLSGGIAVIKVGGYSDVEVKEKIDRVTDALHATRACLDEGFVAGGGVTYLALKSALEELKSPQKSIQKGIDILKEALGYPFYQILKNAGLDSNEYLGKIQDSPYGYGVDVDKEAFVDLLNGGVIDPTKVLRVALESACSIASTFLSTGGIVFNDEHIMKDAQYVQ